MASAIDIATPGDDTVSVRVHRPTPPRRHETRRPSLPSRWTARAAARVLVAEDDAAMRALLVAALAAEGYQIIEVANGAQLARCVLDPRGITCPVPDLIITDVRMPEHTGLDVLATMREIDWATPVIVITAFGDSATHDEASRLGAARVLDKPFDIDELLHAASSMVPPTL